MRLLLQLSAVALRQVVGVGADGALQALADRFGDRSGRLIQALLAANRQAWKAIEIALAGTSWWERCKLAVASGEEHAFRSQIRAFLDAAPLAELPGDPAAFRRQCLAELKAARAQGLVPGEDLSDRAALCRHARDLTRFRDPAAVLEAEFRSVLDAGEELRARGHAGLGRFVALRPGGGQPLLVVAVQYFFRRAVEADPRLAAEFQFHEVTRLSKQQEAGFQGLHAAIAGQGERLEALLANAAELLEETRDLARESRDVGRATLDEVAGLRAEMARQSEAARQQSESARQAYDALYRTVLDVLARQGAAPPTPARPPTADAVAEMRDLVEQCGSLPAEEKRQHRALFRAVGRLKATVKAHESQRPLRKNVLPSALFTAGPPAAPEPVPPPAPATPAGRALLGAAFAVEISPDEPPPVPAPAPADEVPPPGTTRSVFGDLPKPTLHRPKPDDPSG